ncbi:MAG TPA: hypothetical protein VLR26_00905, partial [Frankiaceae bacterium]|nr:hypothetical protein [Frankiaceae bacterium]
MTPDAPVSIHRAAEVPAQRSAAEKISPPIAPTPVDEAVQEAVRVAGAVTSVLVEELCRVAVPAVADGAAPSSTADLVVGAGAGLFRLAAGGAGLLSRATRPLTSVLLHPPGLPDRFTPARQLQEIAALGRRESAQAERLGSEALRVLIPKLVDWLLDRVDLQSIVARIDLDQAVRSVDIDAIAARLDLDPILDRAPVNRAAAHVDVDAVADRLDLERV